MLKNTQKYKWADNFYYIYYRVYKFNDGTEGLFKTVLRL